jgi:hypothetical protein
MITCSQFCSEWRATPSRAPNAARLAGKRVIYDLLMKAAAETLPYQCPISRDFVPWRFLDAGRLTPPNASSFRRPKTCTRSDVKTVTIP